MVKDIFRSDRTLIPTSFACWTAGKIVLSRDHESEAIPVRSQNLTPIGDLKKAAVFAGRGWRIGRMADFELDPRIWKMTRSLPTGFPPTCKVLVPAEGTEFALDDRIGGGHHVVLPINGKDLEEILNGLLTRLRDSSLQTQAELVQEAFDLAYGKVSPKHEDTDTHHP